MQTTSFRRLATTILIAAALVPTLAAAQLGAPAFALGQAIPERSVQVIQVQPPFQAKPTSASLRSLLQKPSVVTYVIPDSGPSRQAALELQRQSADWQKLQLVVVVRAQNMNELQSAMSWLETAGITGPVVLDNDLGLAMGLRALRVPYYGMVDAGGVLKVRSIGDLEETLSNGKTFAETVAAVEAGEAMPVSDGPQRLDTKNLVGKNAPSVRIEPAPFREKLTPIEIAPDKIAKPTLMVFWLATCPHCQREMPRIWAWADDRDDEVRLVTVTRTESSMIRQHTERYLAAKDLDDMPVYSGTEDVYKAFQVAGIPTWALIGKNGKIVDAYVGEDPSLERRLDAALAKAK